jgi:hypothetical protein
MKKELSFFRATAALIGFAALALTPAAMAQVIPRMGAFEAPVGGFRGPAATASVAAASMMPEISSWETVFAAPSVGLNAALPTVAAAAAPAALAAAPSAAASTPEPASEAIAAASTLQSPAAAAPATAFSNVHARAGVRIAELMRFFSGRKDADLAAAKSIPTVGKPGAGRPSFLARAAASAPGTKVASAGLGALLMFQAHPVVADQASAPSLSDPVMWPFIFLGVMIVGGLAFAIAGFVNATMGIAAIDSALRADTARQKKKLGLR